MRKGDTELDPEAQKEVRRREATAINGVILTIGGLILATVRPELAVYGVGAALIGAGVVDFKTLARMVLK